MAKTALQEPDGKVCIAQIGAPNGVRGDVRVKLFSDDPEALEKYGSLSSADGQAHFTAVSYRPQKTVFIVRFKEITSRNDAESLNGTKLYVDRDLLPEPEDEEFYVSDLIGMRAELEDGSLLGTILTVHDFGAGDLLDIAPPKGKSQLVPFTREAVPHIDLDNGIVTVVPPEGLFEDSTDASEKRREGEGADFSANPELLDGLSVSSKKD